MEILPSIIFGSPVFITLLNIVYLSLKKPSRINWKKYLSMLIFGLVVMLLLLKINGIYGGSEENENRYQQMFGFICLAFFVISFLFFQILGIWAFKQKSFFQDLIPAVVFAIGIFSLSLPLIFHLIY